MENKSKEISALLMCLREDIGRDKFDITDHWAGDPFSVGISKKHTPSVLVYIRADENTTRYYLALEGPSENKEYEESGEFNDLTYKEILPIVKGHLCLKSNA